MIDDFRPPKGNRPGNNGQSERRARIDYIRAKRPDAILPRPKLILRDRQAPTQITVTQDNETIPQNPVPVIAELDKFVPQDPLAEHNSGSRFGFLPALLRKRPSKRQAMVIAAVLAVLTGAVSAYVTSRDQPDPVAKKPAPAKAVPKPKPILSPLTGMAVTAEQQARPVTAVMVENSPDARPQSGLKDAGIVFEAIAEYGITRFMGLYQESAPASVGPVRSARPYFLEWALPFDANYAHVGGSPEALQLIPQFGVRGLDQFHNSGAYSRITTRFAPHNVYTGLDRLVGLGNTKGYVKSTFTPLPRKANEQPAKVPAAKTIDLAIAGAYYNVHYDYDAATNTYKRVMGGTPHLDQDTQAQIAPKVVVALAMQYSVMADGVHSHYGTVGSGNMLVFQDGQVTAGTWAKSGPKDQFVFKDGAGAAIMLNPGQTWITILGDITQATYAP